MLNIINNLICFAESLTYDASLLILIILNLLKLNYYFLIITLYVTNIINLKNLNI